MFSYKIDAETELRLFTPRHGGEVFALMTENPERHPELDKNFSLADVQEKIRHDLALFAENKGLSVGIWYRGKLAGGVRYHEIDWANRAAELGYWLGESFEGKGLVIKTCRVLIDSAFGELKLNRIVISCAAENQKSRRIPEKLGFRQESILRESEWLQNRFADMITYGLLASEWQNKK